VELQHLDAPSLFASLYRIVESWAFSFHKQVMTASKHQASAGSNKSLFTRTMGFCIALLTPHYGTCESYGPLDLPSHVVTYFVGSLLSSATGQCKILRASLGENGEPLRMLRRDSNTVVVKWWSVSPSSDKIDLIIPNIGPTIPQDPHLS
jgi:hypothetical protein